MATQEEPVQDSATLLKEAERFDQMAREEENDNKAEGYRRVAEGCRRRAEALKE